MLILASESPRRRALLEIITQDFRVISSDVSETLPSGMLPRKAVEELALRKAKAVSELYPNDIVIGADTVVSVDDRMLGKPENTADARRMLKLLAGRQHCVYTGVAILSPDGGQVFSEMTDVYFADMTAAQIDAYIETGEPMDKAGGYGIQGKGALFVEGISGDFYNVMGLPLCKLSQALLNFKNNGKIV